MWRECRVVDFFSVCCYNFCESILNWLHLIYKNNQIWSEIIKWILVAAMLNSIRFLFEKPQARRTEYYSELMLSDDNDDAADAGEKSPTHLSKAPHRSAQRNRNWQWKMCMPNEKEIQSLPYITYCTTMNYELRISVWVRRRRPHNFFSSVFLLLLLLLLCK